MNTCILKLDPQNIDAAAIERAGCILKAGGLVAFPTETVYGLGGDALNPAASGKIYAAKGRPSDNPLIVHIADMEHLYPIVREVPEKARLLASKWWPGPLTMIFNKTDLVPKETSGGLSTVAVRMPNHPIALALIRAEGGYIAAPSANTSGRPSPTRAEHVAQDEHARARVDGRDGVADAVDDVLRGVAALEPHRRDVRVVPHDEVCRFDERPGEGAVRADDHANHFTSLSMSRWRMTARRPRVVR